MLTIKQGKTWVQPLSWLDENDDPVDLTGCVFRAQVRSQFAETDTGDPLLEFTMTSGITIDGDDIILRAEASDTEAVPSGRYLIELEVTLASGDEDQVFLDEVTVDPEVVR